MAVEVPDGLDLVGLAVDLDFVRLHDLLDGGADVAQPHVDAALADPRVGGVAHRLEQFVVLVVERQGEGAVDDPACPLIKTIHSWRGIRGKKIDGFYIAEQTWSALIADQVKEMPWSDYFFIRLG